jgi:hypothetical protein
MRFLLRTKNIFAFLALTVLSISVLNAQHSGVGNGTAGGQVINTVTTAVPFLRIDPDARAGGMGDVGIASPTDANGVYMNPAKMAFIDKDYGFAVSFTPWLKALVNDIYLASITGYIKVKKQQTLAVSLRYFSLGNIQFTDENGTNLNQFRPNEFAVDVHYARILGKNFALAASLRFIYSNLAGGQQVSGLPVSAGMAGSGDISWYYRKKFKENEEHKMEHEFAAGMYVSNIGSKISYTSSTVKDFIPTNLGVGFGYTLNIDKHNSIGAYADFNKLLVPTPDTADANRNGIYDFREKSSITGIFSSFTDAPGGVAEEFRQITMSFGAEYFYSKQFGVRLGYFYEPYTNGGRQYLTAGLTVKYSIVGLHFSYLIPTTIQRNPLDNTLRFSLLFDFAKGGKKSTENNSGISLVPDEPKKVKKANAVEPQTTPTPPGPTPTPKPTEGAPPAPK